jgi:hypothetical protein
MVRRVLLALVVLVSSAATAQDAGVDLVGELVDAAIERTRHRVTYDGSYHRTSRPISAYAPTW